VKILVVDDDRVQAIQTRRLLERLGNEAFIAESGKDALQRLRSESFSVVISVWQMPDIQGVELARRVRASSAPGAPYVILVSTIESLDDWRTGFESGVDDYLVKPIESKDLFARLYVAERMIRAKASIGSELAELSRVKADLERLTLLHARTTEDVGRFCRDLEFANVQLKALSITDSLTGLKHHREFQERLEDEVHRAKRYDLPLSLIMLDVDHFKPFNDAYGHPAGDEVLRRLAKVLERQARETDIIARYGGEEFAIILGNTDREQAVTAAERLRAAVSEESWPHRRITVSMGVSTLASAVKMHQDLIAEADKALYASKSSGRNCISHYASTSEVAPD
jgi:diguanylate cyclase (GGDEF)-like protein